MMKKSLYMLSWGLMVILLSACSSFTGIRTPKYDGQPFVTQPEKIAAYENGREVIGEEKENYILEPFSEDILKPTLDTIEHEPILLEEGTYVVGDDFPAGRVSLYGKKEDPSIIYSDFEHSNAPPSPENYHVGTMTIRDAAGKLYFENMFHEDYGVLISQVDFIEGHTIEIVGNNPEIVVFYSEELPNNPYVFDTRAEEYEAQFEGLEIIEVEEMEEESEFEGIDLYQQEQEQPITIREDGSVVELSPGIYEVGKHFEAGTYKIADQLSPNHTQLYLFRGDEEPRVFEMSKNLYGLTMWSVTLNEEKEEDVKPSFIELLSGDKIYPHYVNYLKLTKID